MYLNAHHDQSLSIYQTPVLALRSELPPARPADPYYNRWNAVRGFTSCMVDTKAFAVSSRQLGHLVTRSLKGACEKLTQEPPLFSTSRLGRWD